MTDEKRAAMHAAIDEAIDAVLAECPGAVVTYVTCVVTEDGEYLPTVSFRSPGGTRCHFAPYSMAPWSVSADPPEPVFVASLSGALAAVEASDV